MAGFFKNFDSDRVQIIGKVESDFLKEIEDSKERQQRIEKFMEHKEIPCSIICLEEVEIDLHMLCCALQSGIPLFKSKLPTSTLLAEVNRWLQEKLAPRVTRHGILVDVYGEGVLIMGESGIGKSEAALELVRRGHRLVADDAVEIKKIADRRLTGSGPEIIRYLIELRGIGIINVKELFGVGSVISKKTIDLVIKLEFWDEGASGAHYDRLGFNEEYIEILGNKVKLNTIPVRPGRNVAMICESAAMTNRQKKMGMNTAQEFANRIGK